MNKDKKFNLTDPLEQDIAEYLYEYHKGINNAISNKILADIFHLEEGRLRQIIAKLIVVDLLPIGSCSSNISRIFYIDDEEDFKIASRELLSRIKKLSRRHKALRIAYNNYKNEQIEQLELIDVRTKPN